MTNTTVSLGAFMRRLSRWAEKTIKKHGSVGPPTWIVYTEAGEELLISTPVLDDRDRVEIPKDMRAFFKQRGVTRSATIREAWVGTERTELVDIEIEDASGEALTGYRRIVRSKVGKPRLEKLEIDERAPRGLLCPDFTTMTGDEIIAAFDTAYNDHHRDMYAAFLLAELGRGLRQGEPRLRITAELPDPKMAPEFATYNEKFGIIGRRLNDELLIMDITGHPWDPATISVEVLAAPEGERLIATVLAKLHDNAMPAEAPRRPYFNLQQNGWLQRRPSSEQGGGWRKTRMESKETQK